ncbi:hypothetical protein AYO49_04810 [Verrucomicrobiaceae bacterium SCGC AG-212-N21]|nr:hypothetical protein AYO49_04810 [Verrucomicrobiaceae bacterium SCGC AG-212-N21]
MTKRLWKPHSWLGLLAGLGLPVIGATGSLLVVRDEVDGIVAHDIMRQRVHDLVEETETRKACGGVKVGRASSVLERVKSRGGRRGK